MGTISSGIPHLDVLIDSLHIGDNVVWEIDAGTSYHFFIQSFMHKAFKDAQKVIYVSFNRSPQSILNEIGHPLPEDLFILVDCFTSGKGKNDHTFTRFYETQHGVRVVRIEKPADIGAFTEALNKIEDNLPEGVRYVFDSMTGMQDLWSDENDTYRFFTHMCPRLFDLGTVAYWILEKDAHSQKFKANLRHITQVVFDLYKRREKLYIKALKLEGRRDREAFKPHQYSTDDGQVLLAPSKKEVVSDIGGRLKELRLSRGISQKDLADKISLTPSFISQLENNQISPSLSSFLQICTALNVDPGNFLSDARETSVPWLFRKEAVLSHSQAIEDGVKGYPIISEGSFSARLVIMSRDASLDSHFLCRRSAEFVMVLKGTVSVHTNGKREFLGPGDSAYLREFFPHQWKNEGGDEAELLIVG
jgi:transcriptional regulator with XRE-family HTH domain